MSILLHASRETGSPVKPVAVMPTRHGPCNPLVHSKGGLLNLALRKNEWHDCINFTKAGWTRHATIYIKYFLCSKAIKVILSLSSVRIFLCTHYVKEKIHYVKEKIKYDRLKTTQVENDFSMFKGALKLAGFCVWNSASIGDLAMLRAIPFKILWYDGVISLFHSR